MPESLKSQISHFIAAGRKSRERHDPEFCKIICDNAVHLFELAEKADNDDPEALQELYAILERIDQVTTEAHERVVAELGKRKGAQPDEPGTDFVPESHEIASLLQNLEASYDQMVDTLTDYGYHDKIPGKLTVMEAIEKLGPEMLKKINNFIKPTVLITPAGTLKNKIKKLDGNKKYDGQDDTYFGALPEDELWGPAPAKLKVSLVDEMSEMPQLPGEIVKQDWKARHRWLTSEYKKEGMAMITAQEYAMLAQKSLLAYELGEEKIIDQSTYTVLNCEHMAEMVKVPSCAGWDSDSSRFYFAWNVPNVYHVRLRSRPSVQVLEYDENNNEIAEKGARVLTSEQKKQLLKTLETRFEANMHRHPDLHWMYVEVKFVQDELPEKLWSLYEMERTGGEPDVVGRDGQSNEYIFMDCSAESPAGRRNCVYDREAEEFRISEGGECKGNAVDMAAEMGIELLTEEQYRNLQTEGEFDKNSSSWLKTPSDIRKEGGFALFGNCLGFDVHVGRDGADCYYDRMGFRGVLRI
jgi:hypothetical protein